MSRQPSEPIGPLASVARPLFPFGQNARRMEVHSRARTMPGPAHYNLPRNVPPAERTSVKVRTSLLKAAALRSWCMVIHPPGLKDDAHHYCAGRGREGARYFGHRHELDD